AENWSAPMKAVELEHPTGETLTAYGLGQLGEEELAAIDSHLADCAICREVVEGVVPDTLLNLLRSAGTETDSTDGSARARSNGDGAAPTDHPVLAAAVPAALTNHPRYRVGTLLGVGGM